MINVLYGDDILNHVQALCKKHGACLSTPPHLHIFQVGNYPPSTVYVNHKKKVAENIGFKATIQPFDEHEKNALTEALKNAAHDSNVHGMILQLPLPNHFNQQKLLELIPPHKDVDGLTITNAGKLYVNTPHFIPCTPLGVMALLRNWRQKLHGLNALVVGRSPLVGRPLSILLQNAGCTVTVATSHTKDLNAILPHKDIVISCVGKPGLINAKHCQPGACLIDVGIIKEKGKLFGDIVWCAQDVHISAASPVPGGVGPTTIAFLMLNLLKAAFEQEGKPLPKDMAALYP